LFVRDNSNTNRVFAVSLGATLDSLLTNSGVTATPGDATTLRNGTPITEAVALPTFHSDDLQAFMTTSSALGYSFAILGGDTLGSTSAATPWRFGGTNSTQFDSTNQNTTSNSSLSSTASGVGSNVNTLFQGLNAALGPGASLRTSRTSTVTGSLARSISTTKPFGDITSAVGATAHLYMLTSSIAAGSDGERH